MESACHDTVASVALVDEEVEEVEEEGKDQEVPYYDQLRGEHKSAASCQGSC